MLYYIIELEDKRKNRRVTYIADSYMITEGNVLSVKSLLHGNRSTIIDTHEHITITPIQITNENERNI